MDEGTAELVRLVNLKNKDAATLASIRNLILTNEKIAFLFNRFGTVTEEDQLTLCEVFNIEVIPKNRLVIKQNTKSNLKVLVCLAGKCKVYKDEGKSFTLLSDSEKKVFTGLVEVSGFKYLEESKKIVTGYQSAKNTEFDRSSSKLLDIPDSPGTSPSHTRRSTTIFEPVRKQTGSKLSTILPNSFTPSRSRASLSVTSKGSGAKFVNGFASYLVKLNTNTLHRAESWLDRVSEVEAELDSLDLSFKTLDYAQRLFDALIVHAQMSEQTDVVCRGLFGKELRQLRTGDMFGERALENRSVRTASVITTADSIFLTLGAEEYYTFVKYKAKAYRDAKHELFVSKFPGYSKLSKEDLWRFQYIFKLKKSHYGQKILNENNKPNYPILIKSGQIMLSKSPRFAEHAVEWKNNLNPKYAANHEMLHTVNTLTELFPRIVQADPLVLGYQGDSELLGVECMFSRSKNSFFTAKVVSGELEYYEIDDLVQSQLSFYKMIEPLMQTLVGNLKYRADYISKRLELFKPEPSKATTHLPATLVASRSRRSSNPAADSPNKKRDGSLPRIKPSVHEVDEHPEGWMRSVHVADHSGAAHDIAREFRGMLKSWSPERLGHLNGQIRELRVFKRSEPRTLDGKRRLEDLYNTEVYKQPPSKSKQLFKELPPEMVPIQNAQLHMPKRKKKKVLLLSNSGLDMPDKIYNGITPVRVLNGKLVTNADIVPNLVGESLLAKPAASGAESKDWSKQLVNKDKYQHMSSMKHLLHPDGPSRFDTVLGEDSGSPQNQKRVAGLRGYFISRSAKSHSTLATRYNSRTVLGTDAQDHSSQLELGVHKRSSGYLSGSLDSLIK